MTWTKKHPVEVAAEWVAPALLAAAASWAASAMGLPLPAIGAVGAIALTVAVLAMRLSGGASGLSDAGFEPVPIEIAAGEMGELLLDDPLVEMAPDSRVVRLFAGAEPTPGELVLRIEDYLNDGRRTPAPAIHDAQQGPTDASAALNAALANIRATLR